MTRVATRMTTTMTSATTGAEDQAFLFGDKEDAFHFYD